MKILQELPRTEIETTPAKENNYQSDKYLLIKFYTHRR